MIQLQRLEGFYRVAKAGGYARAVREFPYPITEPAVHQQVKKLEAELGQRLLRRVAKDRMALTAPGELLFEFCAPFFERLPALEGEVRAGGRGGTLRIDAGPLEVRHVLPAWLRQVQRHHPSTRVELREVLRFDVERLRTGATDVIVEHFPNPPRDVTQRLVTKAHGTLVAPSHWTTGGQVALANLRDKPFVSLELASEEYALQLQGLRFLGLHPSRLLSASTVDAILGFVQAGLGFSLIPWPGREVPRLSGVTCQRLKVKGAVFPITASFHKSRTPNPLLMAALRLLPRP